ncbi:Uroplakin-3b-like protein [Tupaia chinensis]|uniref:Uroplakin-3b-like protein n=1 Tax=Tupaia chinensis TaxID=246437 RepID=L9K1R3_TUPCH|nr:Uroplakin-3b-like protein [Tupaia chinensis]
MVRTARRHDSCWMPGWAMGPRGGQSGLLMPLLLLLTQVQPQEGLERISYTPQLSSPTLAGRLTQSTFTLEQPLGQFHRPNISDYDSIWLVVAHGNATQNFRAPQRTADIPTPADFHRKGYYLTLMAHRGLYPAGPASSQLRVLRVGNDTSSPPQPQGAATTPCRARAPTAQALRAAPGPQSAGTVVIIAILSVLLAVLLVSLLSVLIYTCFDSCRSTSISGPGEPASVRTYTTHHTISPPAEGRS